ncbi:alpha/beta hydrolase family protein [Microbulbifer taiwanensis]|uniref:alpha/beta hydrolase family protein n=1 Tax=Microbulbifer taiwanensis TaxID=986746 RepID=UPI0029BFDA23|nr:prolyl oligopeptidase family serine peptidase [Microbulbifer taiwanensis]
MIHGDSPFDKPEYQDFFAQQVAHKSDNLVAVGLLRPGYTDPQGNVSEGERGLSNGDNYNARNTDAIAASIRELKKRYQSGKVVVAGHSGGAAITANILSRHGDLIDDALLVSCPCDVNAWRSGMLQLTGYPVFKGEIDTLSPIEQVAKLSDHTNITMIVGSRDKVAPPELSEGYRAAASKAGKEIRLVRLEKGEHDIFLEPEVIAELTSMLK